MKKIILLIPFILTLFVFHTPWVLAENLQVVTPQELFLVVEKSIPERQTSQLEKESTLAAATQASLLPNPEVQTSLGSRSVDTGSTDDTGPSIQLSISQELDIWGVREAKSKALKAEADLPAVKLNQIERERFFQVAALIVEREVIESHSKQLREDLADGRKLIEVLFAQSQSNTLRKAEIELISSEYRFLEIAISTLEQKSAAISFAIKSLLGGQNLKLTPKVTFPKTLPTTNELLAEALEISIDLKSLNLQHTIAGNQLEVAKRERHPNVKVGPYYQEEHGGDMERTFGVQVSLPLPIWNDNAAAIMAGQKNLDKTESEKAALMIILERQIEILRSAYLTEANNLFFTVAQFVKESKSLYNKHRDLAAQGVVPLALMLTSHKQYIEARKAEFEASQNVSKAYFALGEKLPAFKLWELGA